MFTVREPAGGIEVLTYSGENTLSCSIVRVEQAEAEGGACHSTDTHARGMPPRSNGVGPIERTPGQTSTATDC